MRLIVSLALVTLLYGFHVSLKTAKISRNPTWDARDEVGQFWSECAFHYRFARFFAEHPVRDWNQLAHDRSVQYPDTINDWAEFTVAMEVPAGVLYRWLQPAGQFHVWVVWYDCLVSSLTLFGVFFLARALWRSNLAGVLASVLYATLYPSYGRTVKNLFLREDFALPLIVFALFFSVRALQEQHRRDQVLAGLFWLAALASWHLTQFVLAVGVGAAALVYLGKGETPRVLWFVLTLAAGAVLIPVLWAKQFYLSPTMCAVYALAVAVRVNGGRRKAGFVFAGTVTALVVLSLCLQKSYGEYAHVYQLFFSKLRYWGMKPENPAALSWEARCLWEGAFNTATGPDFWRSLWWCGPLALVAGWKFGKSGVAQVVFVVFALLLVPLSWMVIRYFTFLAFAAAVLAAGLATGRVGWKAILLAAVGWQLAQLNYDPLDRAPVKPDVYWPVVAWLNANTPTNAVVLSSISESPVWLAHTGRAIVLHSKFENWEIRERYRQFLAALYGTEEQLAGFARRYGADYFIYDRGCLKTGPDTWRYKADRLGPLPADSVARRMDEAPQQLREFEPVLRTDRFTVFHLRPAPGLRGSAGVLRYGAMTLTELQRIYEQPLFDLLQQARAVYQAHWPADEVQLCTLLSIKTGNCSEDCSYCAQSARYATKVQPTALMSAAEVAAVARAAKANGASRFCMGAAWSGVREGTARFAQVLEIIRAVHDLGIEVCVTLGHLTDAAARQLQEAGLKVYNHNLDTGPEYYPQIVTTHRFEDRLETIRSAQQAGLALCCGGIIGLGESVTDRLRMLEVLTGFDPAPESVPLNCLVPIAGTPLEHQPPVDVFELVRLIATTRIALPRSKVRLSAGRSRLSREGQALCFLAGANSIFFGEKLLTAGNPREDADLQLLTALGLKPQPAAA